MLGRKSAAGSEESHVPGGGWRIRDRGDSGCRVENRANVAVGRRRAMIVDFFLRGSGWAHGKVKTQMT